MVLISHVFFSLFSLFSSSYLYVFHSVFLSPDSPRFFFFFFFFHSKPRTLSVSLPLSDYQSVIYSTTLQGQVGKFPFKNQFYLLVTCIDKGKFALQCVIHLFNTFGSLHEKMQHISFGLAPWTNKKNKYLHFPSFQKRQRVFTTSSARFVWPKQPPS